ncbi:copper transporter [Moniliophthora roreri]|nr:copper transporter [Moniliophthora roreri]
MKHSGPTSTLKARGWIPSQAKAHPRHEPRDGLLMCANHHLPPIFASSCSSTTPVTPLFNNSTAKLSPFPSLFIIHEMRVRGFRPL